VKFGSDIGHDFAVDFGQQKRTKLAQSGSHCFNSIVKISFNLLDDIFIFRQNHNSALNFVIVDMCELIVYLQMLLWHRCQQKSG
jgi:hypothetical protein